jgi:hypothetical protein
MDWLTGINEIAWVLGNITVLVIFFAALAFGIIYPLFFRYRETAVGIAVWRAVISVAGFGLLAVMAFFIDGRTEWSMMPQDVSPWRPMVRLLIYGFIGHSFATLVYILLVRRFAPHKIKTAPEKWRLPPERELPRF